MDGFEHGVVPSYRLLREGAALTWVELCSKTWKVASNQFEVLPKLVSLDQDDALIYGAYADACFNLRNWQEAITYYRKALTKEPEKINVQLNLGVALHNLNRLEEAIEVYKAILDKEPNHPGALTNIGVAYQEKRNFIASLHTLEHAADFSPNDPLLLTDLGVVLLLFEDTAPFLDMRICPQGILGQNCLV